MIELHGQELMPVLALRGMTIFPHMLLHFDVGRETSIRALDEAMASGRPIFLVTQRDLTVEEPGIRDLYAVGTVSTVKQILRLPGDNVRVMVEGTARGRLVSLDQTAPYLAGRIEAMAVPAPRQSAKAEALIRSTYELFEEYIELSPQLTADILLQIMASRDPGYIADYIAQNIPMRSGEKQVVLEELRPFRRLEKMAHALGRELEILRLEQDMALKFRDRLSDDQRDYYLRERVKALQAELGEETAPAGEAEEYRQRILAAGLPAQVEAKLLKEADRLARQPFGSAETSVLQNYLDVCLELPWTRQTSAKVDLNAARRTLDRDHYGLDKVKERVLEYLAVYRLSPHITGQILCLVGPPGVGKTSVAASVAKATGRKLARVSLGGVRDEAEIRGHRKTYVGAMPGRIMDALRQAGCKNPLLLLDEVDKMTSDLHGDPASALLEVLDGEQNSAFRDHFVELPFDLSQVLFITTANTTSTIPKPLLDRMEVIELTSYTDEEKLQIAKRHLLPKQRQRHGLRASQLRIGDSALRALIDGYTRESGVRVLERQLAALCRKAAMAVETGKRGLSVAEKDLQSLLGPRKYHPERREEAPRVGVVNGLAWTSVGGELLQVEANAVPGTGKLRLTGNLGDVMKESAQAAVTYIRSRAGELGVDPGFHQDKDLHVHFPEGATPKDGPSAGVAVVTALVSALTGTPVRSDIAMTGEITLRGRVLPIGGLKEKTMAALRNGIGTVLLPADNLPDLEEIDPTVRARLRFIPVEDAGQVLAAALAVQTVPAEPAADWTPPELPGTPADRRLNLTQ